MKRYKGWGRYEEAIRNLKPSRLELFTALGRGITSSRPTKSALQRRTSPHITRGRFRLHAVSGALGPPLRRGYAEAFQVCTLYFSENCVCRCESRQFPLPCGSVIALRAPKLLERLRRACRRRGYSLRTEEAYRRRRVRYVRFHDMQHPRHLGADDVRVSFLISPPINTWSLLRKPRRSVRGSFSARGARRGKVSARAKICGHDGGRTPMDGGSQRASSAVYRLSSWQRDTG
jgi:hypothetical protein